MLVFAQPSFANAKVNLEKVINGDVLEPATRSEQAMTNILPDVTLKSSKSAVNMTNYQYDEMNYHYHKVDKYIQDNINYSMSGKMKY